MVPAIDAGHGQLHQDGADRRQSQGLFVQQGQGGVARSGLQDTEVQGLQPAGQQGAVDLFVVHHQHAMPRAGMTGARRQGWRRLHALQLRQEETHAKQRAAMSLCSHRELEAVLGSVGLQSRHRGVPRSSH
jgi:hypothetical protein